MAMKTSNMGCKLGMSAVGAALVSTLVHLFLSSGPLILVVALVLVGLGGGGGVYIGEQVDPIKLPQTVAAFHSLVGLAAMVTSIGNCVEKGEGGFTMENIFGLLGDFIGGITLTGSIIAYLKLDGKMSSAAWNLPMKNLLNIGALACFFVLSYLYVKASSFFVQVLILWLVAALACWMGVHLVASVG